MLFKRFFRLISFLSKKIGLNRRTPKNTSALRLFFGRASSPSEPLTRQKYDKDELILYVYIELICF